MDSCEYDVIICVLIALHLVSFACMQRLKSRHCSIDYNVVNFFSAERSTDGLNWQTANSNSQWKSLVGK